MRNSLEVLTHIKGRIESLGVELIKSSLGSKESEEYKVTDDDLDTLVLLTAIKTYIEVMDFIQSGEVESEKSEKHS